MGNAQLSAAGAWAISPNVQLLLGLVVLAQVAEFSVVGGALLARYMIPAIPPNLGCAAAYFFCSQMER